MGRRGELAQHWPQRQEGSRNPAALLSEGQAQDVELKDAQAVVLCPPCFPLAGALELGPLHCCRGGHAPCSSVCACAGSGPQPASGHLGTQGPFCLYSSGILGFSQVVIQSSVQLIPRTDDRRF